MNVVKAIIVALAVLFTASHSFAYEVVYGLSLKKKAKPVPIHISKAGSPIIEAGFKYSDSRNLVVRLDFAKKLTDAQKQKMRKSLRKAGIVLEGATANFWKSGNGGSYESNGFGFEKKLIESFCFFCSKGDSVKVKNLSWKLRADSDDDDSSYTMELKATTVTTRGGKVKPPSTNAIEFNAKVDRIEAREALAAIFEKFSKEIPMDRRPLNLANQVRILSNKEFEAAWARIPGDNGPVPDFGFTDHTRQPKVIFARENSRPHTILHELLHLMSNPEFRKFIPSKINEGMTQSLTLKALIQKDGNIPVNLADLEYVWLVAIVKENLEKVIKLPNILEAYFGRDRNDIEKLMVLYNSKKGTGAFQKFLHKYSDLAKPHDKKLGKQSGDEGADYINDVLRQ